ncbi:macro domain-containing protein [bacterium]|nr:macro domain-containing protein [bacterium]
MTIGNETILSVRHSSGVELVLVQGDITKEAVDAIVNAANSYLQHGGGVAGAIVRQGGQIIQDESDRLAPIPVGNATWTSAGKLPARYVIHTVGPRWGEGDEDQKLVNAVHSALDIANQPDLQIKSISLPAISTGIYAFPLDRAARIILASIQSWLNDHENTLLEQVRLCLFDAKSVRAFSTLLVSEN